MQPFVFICWCCDLCCRTTEDVRHHTDEISGDNHEPFRPWPNSLENCDSVNTSVKVNIHLTKSNICRKVEKVHEYKTNSFNKLEKKIKFKFFR